MTSRARARGEGSGTARSPRRTTARRARALGAVLLAAVLAAVVLFAPRAAEACSCMMPPGAAAALEDADAVFVARIQSVRPSGPTKLVQAQVLKAWKGAEFGTNVEVRTAANSAACGVAFHEGESWLVYATGREGRELFVSLCSRTAPLERAQSDVALLDEAIREGSGSAPDAGALPAERHADSAAPKSADAGAPSAEGHAGSAAPSPTGVAPRDTSPPAATLPKGSSGCACTATGADPLTSAMGVALTIVPLAVLFRRRARAERPS